MLEKKGWNIRFQIEAVSHIVWGCIHLFVHAWKQMYYEGNGAHWEHISLNPLPKTSTTEASDHKTLIWLILEGVRLRRGKRKEGMKRWGRVQRANTERRTEDVNLNQREDKYRKATKRGWTEKKREEEKEEKEEKERTSAVSCRVWVPARDEVRAACWTLRHRWDSSFQSFPPECFQIRGLIKLHLKSVKEDI